MTTPSKITVVVIAPALGHDLQWISDVDPQIEVIDGNALARGTDGGERLLQDADVVLVGYPVPAGIAARAPYLRWAQQTQAGVSNLHGTDLWESGAILTSSRGSVSATGIAEFVIAGVYYFARGLQEATRQKAASEFGRRGYDLRPVTGATIGVALVLGSIGLLNTMAMAVFERTGEIGLLRALGWRRSRIVALLMGEAAALGMAGVVVGALLAMLGMRALMLYTASQQDALRIAAARGGTDPAAAELNDLLLPVVKGVGSERAYEMLTLSLQTLGGSGYLQDYPIEQYIRDAKIDSLYEGTTAIQGLDLFFRKIIRNDGSALRAPVRRLVEFDLRTPASQKVCEILARGLYLLQERHVAATHCVV